MRWAGSRDRSARGSWSCARRASGRWPGCAPPFSARGRAVRLHGRGVDKHLGRGTAGAGQSMEEIDPDSLGGPADIAVIKRLAWPIVRRRIDPAPAGLQDMDDAADHAAVVNSRLASRIRRQIRLDPRELRLREPETIPIHPRFLPEAVNHAEQPKPTPLWVRALRIESDGQVVPRSANQSLKKG